MNKSILTIYLILLAPALLFAQPDWQWGQEVRFNARSIAVDTYGNSYVTWSLQNNYEIDGELFISNGSTDAALTSFDCDGIHRWTKIIGGTGGDGPRGLGTDTLGGVYLAVSANSSRLLNYNTHFDPDTTINTGQKGMLLIKYNTEGDFQWVRMPEDTIVFNFPDDVQIGNALDLDIAPNGDCYLYSRLFPGTYGDGAFEATYDATFQGGEGEDIYVLKYESDGNCTGGLHFDMWYSGAVLNRGSFTRDHHTGKYYRSGYLSGNDIVIFGGEEVTANNYVVQFDSEGFVNWRVSADDSGVSHTYFVGKPSIDELGNVYVTGDSYNENSFGEFDFQNSMSIYNFPIFAKIDSLGTVVFATNASVPNICKANATAYQNNQVAVTGSWNSLLSWGDIFADNTGGDSQGLNVFLALFDASADGTPESFHSLTSSPLGVETPFLLTADQQGNFYVGGNFSGQLFVGDGTLYNQTGTQEGFIAKFGSDTCYCPLPAALFTYDSIPNTASYTFAYTGSAEVDSVVWNFGDGNVGYGLNVEHVFAQSDTYTVCATAYNSCGSDSVCLTIDALGPVGVKTINGFEEIRVYPNPASDLLYIDHDLPNAQLLVLSAVGQKVLSISLSAGRAQIDISALPAGIYLLQLTRSDGKRGFGRFVKE